MIGRNVELYSGQNDTNFPANVAYVRDELVDSEVQDMLVKELHNWARRGLIVRHPFDDVWCLPARPHISGRYTEEQT